MAEAIINIGANTQAANAQIDQLNQNLGKTGKASDSATKSNEKLEAQLKKQEATIKTIDGAVNILGGSVELAASAAIGLGLATEESAKEFEAAALGAIAFADGAKRTVDGVKSLNEGLASYGGIAGAARKAQLALNTAILANPYIAAAAALAILVAGIALFVTSNNDAEESQKKLNDEIAKGAAADADYADLQLRLAKARGENTVKIKEQEIATREGRIEERIAALNAEEDGKKRIALQNEIKKLGQDQKVARVELTTLEAEASKKASEDSAKALEEQKAANKAARDARLEAEGNRQVIKLLGDEFIASLNKADMFYNGQRFKIQEVETDIEEFTFFTLQQLDEFNKAQAFSEEELLQTRLTSITRYYDNLISQATGNAALLEKLEKAKNKALETENDAYRDREKEKREADVKDAVSATLGSIAGFAGTLASIQSENNEAAFESGKKYKIAAVVTSALQSAFEAYSAALKFNGVVPGLGTAIGIANVAAIALASNKAIQGIQSATFEGGGSAPSAPSSGGGTPSISGGGAFTGALPGTGTTPPVTGQTEPIRAYVIAQDVSTGQEANAAIRRRRRLGPG